MRRMPIKLTAILMFVGFVLTYSTGFQAFGNELDPFRIALRGLSGTEVVVEKIAPAVERDGLMRSQVQTDVERRLRQAGIRIISSEERRPGDPYLYIVITAQKRDDAEFYAYSLRVQLNQGVWLTRDPAIQIFGATTWDVGLVGTVGRLNIREVHAGVLDLVDQFINAYLAVNPEHAGAGKRSRGPVDLTPGASTIRQVP
jgi:hypothetical protein